MRKRGSTTYNLLERIYINKAERGAREAALLEWIDDGVERDAQEGQNYDVLERICS